LKTVFNRRKKKKKAVLHGREKSVLYRPAGYNVVKKYLLRENSILF